MDKICTTCGLPKDATTGFHRRNNGYASECKECRTERDKVIYEANGEVIRRRKLWINPDIVSGNKNPVCKECGRGIDEVPFGSKTQNGKRYYRHTCKDCSNAGRAERDTRESLQVREKRYREKSSQQRKDLQNVERWVYQDCLGSDKKHGFLAQFDLTREFIRNLIADGCQYCGEAEIRIGLDRIDNDRGHSKDNVIPCCIRCNYIRRHMPFDAWLAIVPSIKKARVDGLFGSWVGGCREAKGICTIGV